MTEQDYLPTETAYEEQQSNVGDGLPRFYWMNGEPRDKTPGRFWMDAERAENAGIVPANWTLVDHTFKRGETATLYVSPALYIAPISWRQQNFIKNASGGVESWIEERKFSKLAQNEGIAFEMLCLVKGLEQPMVLSLKSTKASMAWAANILPEYSKLRTEIKKSRTGQVIPPWWFWLAIRSAIGDKDKKPVYETVNGSVITPPIWVAPDNLHDRETWKSMYVGTDIAALGEAAYVETGKAWAAKRISEGYNPQTEAVAPAGRNAPQAYSEADEPPF